jgi:hypothetical protein
MRVGQNCLHVVSDDSRFQTGCITFDDCGYANARLIAAAPELLAALKELRSAYSSNAYSPNVGQRYASELADKAIAKAEGK